MPIQSCLSNHAPAKGSIIIKMELKENVNTVCGRIMSTLEITENGQGLPMSKIEPLFDLGHPAEEQAEDNTEDSLFGNFGHGANQVNFFLMSTSATGSAPIYGISIPPRISLLCPCRCLPSWSCRQTAL